MHVDSVAPRHAQSSQNRDQTSAPIVAGRIFTAGPPVKAHIIPVEIHLRLSVTISVRIVKSPYIY